ncbi:hypothetical protein QW060_18920 [Myroides ceti]|uniref:Uncharacterized protein n=1 Tax=Paenimyroides ceti TaxID=395087 RepID=A0ABT8CX37_9FLAO|nr:hypothetical protein [Paenimyroides ceti]MDN3709123.1 hypothetical protein [Paenimyroides ceti]
MPECVRWFHNISFIFKVIEGSLYKIGQYPSLDDMNRFKQNKVKEITREIFYGVKSSTRFVCKWFGE